MTSAPQVFRRTFTRASVFTVTVLFPVLVRAQGQLTPGQVNVDTGVPRRTIPEIIAGLVNLGHGMAFFVMTTIFLIGGLYMAASGGQESTLAKGKSLMKAALIGMAIISGSWMILSTFVSFLANG